MNLRPVLMQFVWTPERIEELRRRWPYESSGAIAKSWGVTRNTIIGKVNRLRLSKAAPVTEHKACPLVGRVSSPRPASVLNPVAGSGGKKEPAPICKPSRPSPIEAKPMIEVAPDLVEYLPVLFAERKDCQCVWPLGDPLEPTFRVCGRPIVPNRKGRALRFYCAEHQAESVGRGTESERRAVRDAAGRMAL